MGLMDTTSIETRKKKEVLSRIDTFSKAAEFMNSHMSDYKKYLQEIARKNGWKIEDGGVGKTGYVLRSRNSNDNAGVYWNSSFRKFVSREF